MTGNFTNARLAVATMSILAIVSVRAQASQCSQASSAGYWAYTYTGMVYVPDAAPIAAVGHFHQDAKGNVTGGQTHTLAGQTELEDISATATVNGNCTGSATINVYLAGVLLRTTTVDVAYDRDSNHVRMIFTSLILADGTVLPVVATLDGNRVSTKD